MQRSSAPLIIAVIAAIGLYLYTLRQPTTPPQSNPAPVCPCPRDDDDEKPDPFRRRKWGAEQAPAVAGHKPVIGGMTSPDGKSKVSIDLDSFQRRKNIASGGLGCCGSRSLQYAADYVGVAELHNLPEQMRRDGIPGGDNQYTIAAKMKRYAPNQPYLQDTKSTIEVLSALLKTHRIPCIGYGGRDPHYNTHVDHCVNVVCVDVKSDWVCILDNNTPSKDQLVWMGIKPFMARWDECLNRWVYALLALRSGSLPHKGEEPDKPSAQRYEYRPFPDVAQEWGVWMDGVQVGNWRADQRLYYPRIRPGEWGTPTDPPSAPPGWNHYPALEVSGRGWNYGIAENWRREAPSALLNGKMVSREELLRAIGPELVPLHPKDGDKFSLAGIGGGTLALVITVVVILLCVASSQPPKEH